LSGAENDEDDEGDENDEDDEIDQFDQAKRSINLIKRACLPAGRRSE